MRAEQLAVKLLEYGHTVAWTCDATTLPRRTVHRAAYGAGLTWHEASDTFRGAAPQPSDVRSLIAGMTAALDRVEAGEERRVLRREFARYVQRLDRALYPTTTDPLAGLEPAPSTPTPRRRRASSRRSSS